LKGLHINKEIETVHLKGIEVSLLAASNDGIEIIRHRIKKDNRWGLHPQEGFKALEFLQVISGKMSLSSSVSDKQLTLVTGDFLYANPVLDNAILVAEEDSEFLYTSSQPVFHTYSKVIKSLSEMNINVEQKDGYTADHCKRIADLSMKIGIAMDFNYNELLTLNYSSFFHDIGKVCIPDSILNKTTKLDESEWEIVKQHCTQGRNILDETNIPIFKQAGKIVEQHHERYDGTGYPHGLKGDEIDIKAAIISVVDSFDAMTVDRVYQKARTVDEALEELTRCKGTMYHPLVVDTFLSIIENEERK
jgi:HD-GYP domain-containing protein (c-di-GMP phosphodiesterase class II)